MAFYESPRFPERISFGATGGPGYLTDVVVVNSGNEFRNASWSQARAAYDVAHAARLPDAYHELQAFFRAMRGRLHGFRFKDWSDFEATSTQGILVAADDESPSGQYQMYKRYTSGSQTEDRIIRKPVLNKCTVLGGGSYTIDTTTGLVRVNSGAAPTGWYGEFDVPCRFDIDQMRGTIIDKSPAHGLIMGWDSIPIVEIRV